MGVEDQSGTAWVREDGLIFLVRFMFERKGSGCAWTAAVRAVHLRYGEMGSADASGSRVLLATGVPASTERVVGLEEVCVKSRVLGVETRTTTGNWRSMRCTVLNV